MMICHGARKMRPYLLPLDMITPVIVSHFSSTPPVTDVTKAALYIHWPYCKRRCTYCNFNKYISNSIDHERMRHCLKQETKTLLRASCTKHVTSVFFGGGTPSLAQPKTLEQVLGVAVAEASLSECAEVSMEINPTDLQTARLRDFRAAGVNRASIGIQTLNDNGLQKLGRDHTSKESLRCLEEASKVFNGKTSVDLMFGYPGQSLQQWKQEINQILDICDNHISLYQLTLERGTQLFKDVAAGHMILPDTEVIADMYFSAVETLIQKGFEQYEVSNFAKEKNYCQHNSAYWTGQQYIGIGPGSHGRMWRLVDGAHQREARVQTLEPHNWMWEVEKFGHATRKLILQRKKEILEELISTGLRTKWGITNDNWLSLYPELPMKNLLVSSATARWLSEGFLVETSNGVQATARGFAILDSIIPDLLLDLDQIISTKQIALF